MKSLVFYTILVLISYSVCEDIIGNLTENEKLLYNKIEEMQKFITSNITSLKKEVDTIKVNEEKRNTSGICGKDWFAYKDQKCYRVLTNLATQANSELYCHNLDSKPATIESKEEQVFLVDALSKYNSISDNFWIGMKFIKNKYRWIDGTQVQYENWGQDVVKDGSNQCVEMSLGKASLGKWKVDSCNRKCLTLCQQLSSTLAVMRNDLINMSKVISNHQVTIKNITNMTIPNGFIYVQLPNQSLPSALWPLASWTEVTSSYAGLFFRAYGGSAESFGTTQSANYSKISNAKTQSLCGVAHGSQKGYNQFELKEGTWSDDLVKNDGGNCGLNWLQLYTTSGENRPINTAIKIWKKVS